MANFDEKILWVIDMKSTAAEQRVLDHARKAGATGVAIRTSNMNLGDAIGRLKNEGIDKVFAWRWPACREGSTLPFYFAPEQARYVAEKLIPAGLDGYFADIESDNDKGRNDWNKSDFKEMAIDFCAVIKEAAPDGFVFALTSGCEQPSNNTHIPWKPFVDASDYLLPQSYWRREENPQSIHGGTPATAIAKADAAWGPISGAKTRVPMMGELAMVTPAEIAAFGALLVARGERRLHIYVDTDDDLGQQLDAVAAL